jgi:hypothetical protein
LKVGVHQQDHRKSRRAENDVDQFGVGCALDGVNHGVFEIQPPRDERDPYGRKVFAPLKDSFDGIE